MSPARALGLAALLLAVGGACGEGDQHVVPQGVEPTAEPGWSPEVRRPPWRFVFERTGERCRVLRIDGNEKVTPGEDGVACPVDLQVGERIRLAGAVCLREGGAATQVAPVVCPDALTNAEKDHLRALRLIPPE